MRQKEIDPGVALAEADLKKTNNPAHSIAHDRGVL